MKTIHKKRGHVYDRFGKPKRKPPTFPQSSKVPYILTVDDYLRLKGFFAELTITRSEWPQYHFWPKIQGGLSYQVEFIKSSEKAFLLIKFSKPVCRPGKPPESIFRIGGNSNTIQTF